MKPARLYALLAQEHDLGPDVCGRQPENNGVVHGSGAERKDLKHVKVKKAQSGTKGGTCTESSDVRLRDAAPR
jgi:hypothetical protein